MRKSLILMLIATLLVGAFLVSCNSDISSESSNGDKLVKVTIAGNAKGISAVSTSDDADNYYWYYSATKDDSGVYRTGQTDWKAVKANNETGLSGADLGYFSSGAWKFSFYGYTTAQTSKPDNPESSSVYYQEDNAVTVVPTTDTPTYVSVTLKEGSLGETATLVINKMNWKYTPESSTAYSATLANLGEHKTATIHFSYLSGTDAYTVITTATGDVKLYTSADETTTNASDAAYAKADFSFTGNYTIPASFDGKENTIKFWVTIGDETVGDEDTINVVAYSGGVVTLSIDSTGVAVADNEAFNKVIIDENTIGFTAKRSVAVSENKSAAKTIVTKAAPSTESNALTSITFPEGALVASAEDNTTYDVEMDVVVYQTEAAQAKFVIEDTSTTAPSTFAGLDISATLTTTTGTGSSTSPVSQFSDNTAVTIRTYIAKNLTGVQVVYNGSAGAQPTFSGVSFNSEEEFADSSYETGYVKSTGLLVFKTTHFSEFYVGANEKVYDKKTNSGYTVAAFNDLSASVISDHEFILLDAAVANGIDNSRDVFNAGFNWSVVHEASDIPNTTNFAGGYGTKLEPYKISSASQWSSISYVYKEIEESVYYEVIEDLMFENQEPYIYSYEYEGATNTERYYCYVKDNKQDMHIKLNNHNLSGVDYPLFDSVYHLVLKNGKIAFCGAYGSIVDSVGSSAASSLEFDSLTLTGTIETNYSHFGPVVSYCYGMNNYDCDVAIKGVTNNLTIINRRTSSYTGGLIGYIQGTKAKLSITDSTFAGMIQGMYVGGFVGGCSAPNGAVITNTDNKVSGTLLGASEAKAFGVSGNYNKGTVSSVESGVDTTNSTISVINPDSNLVSTSIEYGNEFVISHSSSEVSYYTATLSFNIDIKDGSSGGYPRNIVTTIYTSNETTYNTGLYKCYIVESQTNNSTDQNRVINQSGVVVWKEGSTYYVYSDDYKLSNNGTAYVYIYGYDANGALKTYCNKSYASKVSN